MNSSTVVFGVACPLLWFVGFDYLSRACEQQRSAAAIQAAYGNVLFDYHQTGDDRFDGNAKSPWPESSLYGIGRHLRHRVVFVDLDSPRCNDELLTKLTGCRELEFLSIDNAAITNDGFAVLKLLPRLRVLTINTEGIGDAALEQIAQSPSLEELRVHNANITDAGIDKLIGAKSLRRLWLDETRVSEAGIERLKKALPNCEIEY